MCEMFHASCIAEFVHSALGLPTLLLSLRNCMEFPKRLSSRLENVATLMGSYFSYWVVLRIWPRRMTFLALISYEKNLMSLPSASSAMFITVSLETLEIQAGSVFDMALSRLCWKVSSFFTWTILRAEVSSPYMS